MPQWRGRRWNKSPQERLASYPMEMTSQKESKQNLNRWLLLRNHLNHFYSGLTEFTRPFLMNAMKTITFGWFAGNCRHGSMAKGNLGPTDHMRTNDILNPFSTFQLSENGWQIIPDDEVISSG
jgi:hypothetical protein